MQMLLGFKFSNSLTNNKALTVTKGLWEIQTYRLVREHSSVEQIEGRGFVTLSTRVKMTKLT